MAEKVQKRPLTKEEEAASDYFADIAFEQMEQFNRSRKGAYQYLVDKMNQRRDSLRMEVRQDLIDKGTEDDREKLVKAYRTAVTNPPSPGEEYLTAKKTKDKGPEERINRGSGERGRI